MCTLRWGFALANLFLSGLFFVFDLHLKPVSRSIMLMKMSWVITVLLCSVSLNSALPSLQKLVIILLFVCDAALVLDLSKLGSTLLVHAVLKVATHRAISLSDLSKDVSLVSLLVHGFLEGALLMHPVLTVNLLIDL